MELLSFRIRNYRSISDSGEIKASRITSLLGRNESGKTNLLRALASLNPPYGMIDLSDIKDFPRNRRLSECTADAPVVDTKWELSQEEWVELQARWPRAKAGAAVSVNRRYAKGHWLMIPSVPLMFDQKDISTRVRKTAQAAKAAATNLEEGPKATLEAAADAFSVKAEPGEDAKTWASAMDAAGNALGIALAAADTELSEKQDKVLADLTELAKEIVNDETAQEAARNWVSQKLPTFVYLGYPDYLVGMRERKVADKLNPQRISWLMAR